jgi:hypothetical protein
MFIFFTILKCTAAVIFWDFSKKGCAARENLNEESFEDTPMTIIEWHSQICWSGSELPNTEDDVEIICDNACGLTGPIAIAISTNVTIRSLKTAISANFKYFSLQVLNFGKIEVLKSFLATTNPESRFSLQIFAYSLLQIHESCSLDASVFNAGTILGPQERVTFYAFYIEMCGNKNASLINVDVVSIVGAKNSAANLNSRATFLKRDIFAYVSGTEISAVPDVAYFKNEGACSSNDKSFLFSSVPGIFFSGDSAILINATVSVTSTTSSPSAIMIFGQSLQILVGLNCNFKSSALVAFQNGPNSRSYLSVPCELKSHEKIIIGRAVQLQKNTEFISMGKSCTIQISDFLQSMFKTISGMVTVQNSLNISSCRAIYMSPESTFDTVFALIVINQSLPKTMSLSISNLEVSRAYSTNKQMYFDLWFISCAEIAVMGKMSFGRNTVLMWSCSTSLAVGFSLMFSGQLLKFIDTGNSLVLLDPMHKFDISISSQDNSIVEFDGNSIQIEINTFTASSGVISVFVGTILHGRSQNVSFGSLQMTLISSSIHIQKCAIVKGDSIIIYGSSQIDGILLAHEELQFGSNSNVSGVGKIVIEAHGCLIWKKNDTDLLQPSLTMMQHATMPGALNVGGDFHCNSCKLEGSTSEKKHLMSLKKIVLLDFHISTSMILIAPIVFLNNMNVTSGILTSKGLVTSCSGHSYINSLEFTNEFRIENGSFVKLVGSLFVNASSILNVSGSFWGTFVYVAGNLTVGIHSTSYSDGMELISSANLIISGILIVSNFSVHCDIIECNILGRGNFTCSNSFEIKHLSKLLIELQHLTLAGAYLQHARSEVSISNTRLDCIVLKASILGDASVRNSSIYLFQSSSINMNRSSIKMFATYFQVEGIFSMHESFLKLMSGSEMILGENSNCLIQNSVLDSKVLTISGNNMICRSSILTSDVFVLKNVSVSQCDVVGDVVVESGTVITILHNSQLGINVTGRFQLFGKILVLLDSSIEIGFSMCIWSDANSSEKITSIYTDGIQRENVAIEMKNGCVQLTNKGCPPGKEPISNNICRSCSDGYYNSEYNKSCEECPQGTIQIMGREGCKICEKGSFSNNTSQQNQCKLCPQGMFCNATGLSEPSGFCHAGSYNSVFGAISSDACIKCPVGQYQDMIGQATCLLCKSGTYADKNGSSECTVCRAGRYCLPGCMNSDGDGLCPPGSYSTLGTGDSSSCTSCPEGTYNANVGSSTVTACLKCPAGAFCLSRCNESSGSGPCAAGTYSTEGSGTNASCSPCPVDRLCRVGCGSTFGSTLCEQCGSGKYFDANTTKCQLCSPGTFNNGTKTVAECEMCRAGWFANRTGSTSCLPCSSGYTSSADRTSCVPCPQGMFCNATGLSEPSGFCHAGSYNSVFGAISSDACIKCPVGQYQDMIGQATCLLCKSGTYADKNGSSECTVCRAGRYCLPGCMNSDGDGLCPPGSYSTLGTGDSSSCTSCPEGTYNANVGSSTVTACLKCPAGAFCLSRCNESSGSGPCAAGTYSTEGSGTNASCSPCPVDRLCRVGCGSTFGSTLCEQCGSGKYFDANTTKCQLCSPGTFNNGTKTVAECEMCRAGWFANRTGSTSCLPCSSGYTSSADRTSCVPCPQGMFCNATGLSEPSGFCHAGSYNSVFGAISSDACIKCPVGQYQDMIGQATCLLCKSGTYADKNGSSECTVCRAGRYCLPGCMNSDGDGLCPPGSYSTLGTGDSSSCTSCPEGTYNANVGSSTVTACLKCPAGAFCLSRCNESSGSGPCAAGTYSTEGSGTNASCSPCPVDRLCRVGCGSTFGSTLCEQCGSGKYFDANTTKCQSCSPGTFNNGTKTVAECEMCRAGWFANRTGSTSCLPCSSGYTSSADRTSCVPCPQGMFCNATGLSEPSGFCHAGSYNSVFGAISSDACIKCPVGQYQDMIGQATCLLCKSGTYADKNGSSECTVCRAGRYCLPGCMNSDGDGLCPPGSYSTLGTGDSSSCTSCPEGTYNANVGSSTVTACLKCPAGAFCLSRCNESSGSGPCAAGTYSTEGSGTNASCSPCPVDRLCRVGCGSTFGSTLCEQCGSGKYFDANTTKCQSCSPGTFNNGTKTVAECEMCRAGWFANRTGSTSCLPCSSGYTSSADRTSCVPCPQGMFCNATGLSEPSGFCHAGSYNSVFGAISSDACIKCPVGQYQDMIGQATCLLCKSGTYADKNGSSECTVCRAGRYCLPGCMNSDGDGLCPPGSYSTLGTGDSSSCTSCPEGTYNANVGSSTVTACLKCPAGAFCLSRCNESSGSGPCAAGTYSTEGSGTNASCSPCPVDRLCRVGCGSTFGSTLCEQCGSGKYFDANTTKCQLCSPGTFNNGTKTVAECEMCRAGWFANRTGSTSCLPCSSGYTSSADRTSCVPCPQGMFCNATGLSEPSGFCHAGSYNSVFGAISSDACIKCPVGQYQDMIGQATCLLCKSGTYADKNGSSECTVCRAGRYCLPGCMNSDGDGLCPPGSYSTLGTGDSSSCTSCPEGTYNANVGSSTVTACLKCPAGAFCLSRCNESSGSGPCAAGTYSTEGSGTNASCSPCPVDRLCRVGCGSTFGSTLCEQCGSGKYFDANTTKCQLCSPGTFNNGTKTVAECEMCRAGWFANRTGSTSCLPCSSGYTSSADRTSCVPCPQGMFCNATGLSEPSGFCHAGSYNSVFGAISSDACIKCPVGQYQDMIGQATCLLCKSGTYADKNGSSECTVCRAGRYCLPGCMNSDGDGLCPPGSYSTLGTGDSSSCTSCPEGTYNANVGSSTVTACLKCPAGAFCLSRCNESSGSGPCAAGTYSTEGSGTNASCSPCPVDRLCRVGCGSTFGSTLCEQCGSGKYFDANTTKCQLCSPGTFNNGTKTVAECEMCRAGWFANRTGSTSCLPCSSGYTSSADRTSCVPCPQGMFCNATGLSEPSGFCHAGSYNSVFGAISSDACIKCPVGQYQDMIGQATCLLCKSGTYADKNGSSECTVCRAGRYCLPGCMNSDGDGLCPPGSYSTLGTGDSSSCTSCPEGTYNANVGSSTVTACLKCPAGAFCLSRCNESSGSGPCAAGTYSTEGSGTNASCSPCPVDRLCRVGCGSTFGSTLCEQCGSGKYFDANTTKCQLCSPGTFNNGTKTVAECEMCRAGWFANRTGSTSCLPCSSGYTSSADRTSCSSCYNDGAEDFLKFNESELCSSCSASSFVFDDLCIDPVYPPASVFSLNVSLFFPSFIAPLIDSIFLARYCLESNLNMCNVTHFAYLESFCFVLLWTFRAWGLVFEKFVKENLAPSLTAHLYQNLPSSQKSFIVLH